jgi:hypothetical protein
MLRTEPAREPGVRAVGPRARLARGIGKLLMLVVEGLVYVALALAGMEAVSRLVHGNTRPLLPYIVGADGDARAPSDIDLRVRLPGMETARYVTDHAGARMELAVAAPLEPSWLFVGDSQMLGWGLEFADSLPGRIAGLRGQQLSSLRILASSRQDPAGLLAWAHDYTQLHPAAHRLVAVGVNLGNDLDEIYNRHHHPEPLRSSKVTQWLSLNSVAFLDLSQLMQAIRGWRFRPDPPGLNTALLLIGDDPQALQALVGDTVHAVADLFGALPPAEERVVILIPQDTQVAAAEFDKYRSAYADEPSFERARAMQRRAVVRLNEAESALAQRLQALGYRVVSTRGALQRQYAAQDYFDRYSHHLLRNAAAAAATAFDPPALCPSAEGVPLISVQSDGSNCQ